MRAFVQALMTAAVMAVLAAPAEAQWFETVGVRALGMGGANVAVAEDATAVWWNPAGLATGPALVGGAIELSRFDRDTRAFFGTNPAQRSSFFVGFGALPLGLSYVRTRDSYFSNGPADEAVVRDLATHQLGVTVLQSLTDTIVVGGTLKYVRGAARAGAVFGDLDPREAADELDGRGSNALDADFGVMAVSGDLKVGLTVRNVFTPSFEAEDGTRLEIPWLARAGAAYSASPTLTFAVDVDLRAAQFGPDRRRMLAFGAEWRTRPAITLRAGARFDTAGDVNPLGTVGGSYAIRNGLWIDAWAGLGAEGSERGWGLAGRFVY